MKKKGAFEIKEIVIAIKVNKYHREVFLTLNDHGKLAHVIRLISQSNLIRKCS